MNVLRLIGRDYEHFDKDCSEHRQELSRLVNDGRFLILGGAGSIGQAVVKELFQRKPKVLHVVDISENNLVELVRDIRSTYGYIDGDFRTFALDIGSQEYDAFIQNEGTYDYVLNLSALKHVRSERDPYTLMRMITINILNTDKTAKQAISCGARKYFAVSTDKAANPANMMGASKRIMEMYLMRHSLNIPVSTARFANVAFSDGSLLHGFNQRILKRQPLSAPDDIRRYFMTSTEAGKLCMLSCLLGNNRDIFFPILNQDLHLLSFSEIACNYLTELGYEPYICTSEDEARLLTEDLIPNKKWPCYFFHSDTSGEKEFEEFFMENENLELNRFLSIGVIRNEPLFAANKLDMFEKGISELKTNGTWTKTDIMDLIKQLMPDFHHKETGRHLDNRM